jgi:ATP-dependent Lon protease
MESGVRNLEREIANVLRKVAVEAVQAGFRPPEPITTIDEAAEWNGAEDAEEAEVPRQEGDAHRDRDDEERDDDERSERSASSRTPHTVHESANVDDSGHGPATETGTWRAEQRSDQHGGSTGDDASGNPSGSDDPSATAEHRHGMPHPVAQQILRVQPYRRVISARTVRKYLGKRKYRDNFNHTEARPGLAYGLAWTELGGRLLPVEATVFDGSGQLMLTGSLGDVMKESAHAALSFIRSHRGRFQLPEHFAAGKDVHIHVPEGAIPKDGPSAGVTLTAAILSAFSHLTPNSDQTMTGEITLTGRLLPVGGIKEKALAAHRNKMTTVLLPAANKEDTEELPSEVRSELSFVFADSILEAMRIVFPEELFQIRPY